MKILFPALIALAACNTMAAETTCKPERHALVPDIEGMDYHHARKALIGAGWQPLQVIPGDEVATNWEISFGSAETFWKMGYIEIESCTGTGINPCQFHFSDAHGNHLRVITLGEELPEEDAQAGVSHSTFVCD